jgi:hypothetical protein
MSIPGVLWAFSRGGTRRASLLVWPVVLFAVWPQFDDRTAASAEQERLAATAAPTLDVLAGRLQSNEVALTPSYWPHPDARFFEVVRQFVQYTPEYPYRFLPANATAAGFAEERGLRLRYFTSPTVFHVAGTQELEIPEVGSFVVNRLTDAPLAVELVEGPGTEPPASP